MFTLRDSILIHAPIDRCFALSTSVEVVRETLALEAVAGRTSGLVQHHDNVRWQGRKFFLPQFHVSLIDRFDPPHFFSDRMIHGRFAHFEHEHRFTETPHGTLLEDELRFSLPYGLAGWLAARVVMVPHIRRLLHRRFQLLQRLAETEEWRRYVPQS